MEYSKMEFIRSYYETFYGNEFEYYDWQRYLTMVYINCNGNVNGFNLQRSRDKFKTLIADTQKLKQLRDAICDLARGKYPDSTAFNLYLAFKDDREKFLKSRGTRYRDIYATGGCIIF